MQLRYQIVPLGVKRIAYNQKISAEALDGHAIPQSEGIGDLTVNDHRRPVVHGNGPYLDRGLSLDHKGLVGQGVGRKRRQDDRADFRLKDRSAG